MTSSIILDGVDPRTSREQVENYCQSFGRILNCYIKSSQCTVTFANIDQADEFIRSSPHRLDCYSRVNARRKNTLQPTKSSSIDSNRLLIFGTKDQLNEKLLVDYFSQFGSVRMCQISSEEDLAILTFDQKQTCEEIFKQTRHFLRGRTLKIEIYSETNRKRPRPTSPEVKENPLNENILLKLQFEHQQQINHYQNLLSQMADEVVKKEREVEKLKKENQDLE